ncbi:MAG: hypothetical protein MH204_11685 [Fimbriimonadaceae bacterium]|nr:hypothetical protein [Fimbriimonadaceae bacterium]
MNEIKIQLSDADFAAVEQRAGVGGVEAYVLDMLQEDLLKGAPETFDHLFTPEYLAKLHAASASARAGNGSTWDEVEHRLQALKKEWRGKRSSA